MQSTTGTLTISRPAAPPINLPIPDRHASRVRSIQPVYIHGSPTAPISTSGSRACVRWPESPTLWAIGEAGLDRLRGPGLDVQMPFYFSGPHSRRGWKPLIIHAVRTIPEIISAHKSLKPRVAWIIHGFRGSPEAAKQLLARPGIYISIGRNIAPRR